MILKSPRFYPFFPKLIEYLSNLTRLTMQVVGQGGQIGPKVGQVSPEWDECGIFSALCEYKTYSKPIVKIPRLVLFGVNLTLFRPNLTWMFHRLIQGDQISAQCGSDWLQMGQI